MPTPTEKTYIRIFVEDDLRHEQMVRYTFEPEDFGGTIPGVGDLIASPFVAQGLDRGLAENRTVQEVIARYFSPSTDPQAPAFINLLVRERFGTDREVYLLGN